MSIQKVFINQKGFIEIQVIGVNSQDTSAEIGKEALRLASLIEDEGKEVCILIDSAKVESWTDDALRLVPIIFKTTAFKKVAFFGATAAVAEIQKKALTLSGIKDKGGVFATRAEAEAWLEEK